MFNWISEILVHRMDSLVALQDRLYTVDQCNFFHTSENRQTFLSSCLFENVPKLLLVETIILYFKLSVHLIKVEIYNDNLTCMIQYGKIFI